MGIQNQNFLRTGPILTGLVTALRDLTYEQDGVAIPAFEAVALFDLTDLLEALKELVAAKDRVCLVIFAGTDFDNRISGQALHTKAVRRVTLVVADRNFGDRLKAFIGDDQSPGAYLLADRIVEQLRGPLDGVPGAYIQPMDAEPMSIDGKVRDELVGRGAMLVQLEVVGGEAMANQGQRTY